MLNNSIIIITGKKGEGKTTKLLEISEVLKNNNVRVNGFLAKATIKNGNRSEYVLVDVNSNKSIILCTAQYTKDYTQYGNFYFNPNAIIFGEELLEIESAEKGVTIIDEIGPFEMKNKVWHNSFKNQLKNSQNILIVSVRENLVDSIIDKYNLDKIVMIFKFNHPTQDIISHITYNL